jgi:hypothetical protein
MHPKIGARDGEIGAVAYRRRQGPPIFSTQHPTKEPFMSIGTILLIILILVLVGVLPTWPHARSWGYGPSGIVGVVVVILVALVLLGHI